MSLDNDVSADELGRAFAAMASAARAMPDTIDVWRAIHEWRERVRTSKGAQGSSVPVDYLALMLEANAVVLDSQVKLVRDWQPVIAQCLRGIRERLDDYRAEPDPLPEIEKMLIDEIRNYLRELGEMAEDQGRALKEDLDRLQRQLLPGRPKDGRGARPDRSRVARVAKR